jgi:hypothetical protein
MKNYMTRYLSAILMASTLLISGCEKDKKSSAPELPPLSSFSLQVDAFTTTKSTGSYSNFLTAAFATGYWNTVLTAYLAVPVASYAEAFNHPAERVDNNIYKWSYQVIVHDTTYTANLFAHVDGDMIDMEMHISQQGGFQDFIWYTGSFNILRTEGEWNIQDNPVHDNTWINIAWHHDYAAKTFDIQYTNVYPESEYVNSSIKYGITNESAYNAFYNIYNALDDKTYDINLNTTTHEGRIYYDALWHCWDSNLLDQVCP